MKIKVFSKSYEEFDDLVEKWIIGNGKAVVVHSKLGDFELTLGRWHRSKDRMQKPYSDFDSFMINKKWWLEEQFNVHMMRFQQVKYIYKSTVELF